MSLIVLYFLYSSSVLSLYIDVVLTLSILVEGGSSRSRIQTNIWCQTCSIGFMSGLRIGQSMTSTSCWSKKSAVSCAVWGGALSWTYTKLRPNTTVAHGNIWFLRIWMYRCRFMAPSTTTSSLLPTLSPPPPPPPHPPKIDGPRFPSLSWTQASISPPLAYGAPVPTVTVV